MLRSHRFRASKIEMYFPIWLYLLTKEGKLMLGTLSPGQVVTGSFGTTAKGQPSKATLSNLIVTAADMTVATIVLDPSNSGKFIITGVGTGPALMTDLNVTGLATEADGVTTEQISGTDSIGCSLVTPPTSPADNITFNLDAPIPPPVPTAAKSLFGK